MNQIKGKPLSEVDAAILWAAVKEATAQKAYKLILNSNKTPSVFDSKIGGLPYWDTSLPVPHTDNGKKMALLAQLNMEDYPDNDLLPQKGMLQIFIAVNEMYGIDFDEPTSQNEFRMVFHENIDQSFSPDSIKGKFILPEDVNTFDLPMAAEYALDIQPIVSYMFEYDYRFDEAISAVARAIGFKNRPEYKDISEKDFNNILWNSLEPIFEEDEYSEEFETAGSRVLGYPFFTQSDPRERRGPYNGYDVLLFQLDSVAEEGNTHKWKVIWGDCGIANFFIRKQDLLNRDFSKVLYNWDCY